MIIPLNYQPKGFKFVLPLLIGSWMHCFPSQHEHLTHSLYVVRSNHCRIIDPSYIVHCQVPVQFSEGLIIAGKDSE